MQPSESVVGQRDGGVDVVRRCDVGRGEGDSVPQLGGHRFARRGRKVDHHDLRPRLEQCIDRGPAQAGRTARDEGGLSLDSHEGRV